MEFPSFLASGLFAIVYNSMGSGKWAELCRYLERTDAHGSYAFVYGQGDRVYYAAVEAELVALDAKTPGADNHGRRRQSHLLHYVGAADRGRQSNGRRVGRRNRRPWVCAAYDPDTGKEQWRTYMIPAPGEPGSET